MRSAILSSRGTRTPSAFVGALANSYRYLLKTGSKRLVPLADELALLDQFLSLATIRYAEGLSVDVHVDAHSAARWQIPPVVLPELLENAVKHNEVSTDNPLQIEIRLRGRSADDRPRATSAAGDGLIDGRRPRQLSSAVSPNYRRCRTLGGDGRALRRDVAFGGN